MDVVIPHLGEVDTVRVVRWVRQVGDAVAEGDDLVEITTDKIALTIASPVSGVVATIVSAAGERVSIGAIVGTIAARAT